MKNEIKPEWAMELLKAFERYGNCMVPACTVADEAELSKFIAGCDAIGAMGRKFIELVDAVIEEPAVDIGILARHIATHDDLEWINYTKAQYCKYVDEAKQGE